jgi:hypothetical protein
MAAVGASTTAIVVTSVALAVTGISAKIDKAASKVFGEDVVKFANIAGAVFMAAGGSEWLSQAGASAGSGTDTAINGLDLADDASALADGASGAGGEAVASSTPGVVDASMEAALAENAASAYAPMTDAQMLGGFEADAGGLAGVTASDPTAMAPPTSTPQSSGALSRATQTTPNAAGTGTAPGSGPFDKVAQFWNSSDPKTRGALLQVGGNLLSGGMQGYAQGKQLEQQQAYERERDSIYRSGSGYDYTKYGPRKPVYGS